MSLSITPADREKWLFRVAMKWVRKHYAKGENAKSIHEEMEYCGNPVIRKIQGLFKEMMGYIKERHHPKMISEFSEFALWIFYKDTAYRQPAMWMLKQILDMKEELYPMVMEYYVEPKDWYVNIWHDSKKLTEKRRKEGKIGNLEKSDIEDLFVPSKQQILMDELEKEKKKKGW